MFDQPVGKQFWDICSILYCCLGTTMKITAESLNLEDILPVHTKCSYSYKSRVPQCWKFFTFSGLNRNTSECAIFFITWALTWWINGSKWEVSRKKNSKQDQFHIKNETDEATSTSASKANHKRNINIMTPISNFNLCVIVIPVRIMLSNFVKQFHCSSKITKVLHKAHKTAKTNLFCF